MKLLTLNKIWLPKSAQSLLHERSTNLHALSVARKLHSLFFNFPTTMAAKKKAKPAAKKMPMKKGKCK